MKNAVNILTTFLLSVAQFIIGVFILAGEADIRTIGYYYVISSVFLVSVSILAAVGTSINNEKEK